MQARAIDTRGAMETWSTAGAVMGGSAMYDRMRWSNAGFFSAAVVVVAQLNGAAAPLAAGDGNHFGDTTNFVELIVMRSDDFIFPGDDFMLEIFVAIPGVSGAASVTVSSTGGISAILDSGDNIYWFWDGGFVDLATMKPALDGDWTITIQGDSPSTSTFIFNADALLDSDFFATPTDVFPLHGSANVPPDVIFSWSDPTGPETPDALFVFVGNEMDEQYDDSIFGTLDITDTSWDPPLDLSAGFNEFGVIYANIDAADLVSPLTVTSGSIVWGNSPFAPGGYPPSTPLLVLGSQTVVGFDVASACPADFDNTGDVGVKDLLFLLGAWGPCPPKGECLADFDNTGDVGVKDLLVLLGAWGECP